MAFEETTLKESFIEELLATEDAITIRSSLNEISFEYLSIGVSVSTLALHLIVMPVSFVNITRCSKDKLSFAMSFTSLKLAHVDLTSGENKLSLAVHVAFFPLAFVKTSIGEELFTDSMLFVVEHLTLIDVSILVMEDDFDLLVQIHRFAGTSLAQN